MYNKSYVLHTPCIVFQRSGIAATYLLVTCKRQPIRTRPVAFIHAISNIDNVLNKDRRKFGAPTSQRGNSRSEQYHRGIFRFHSLSLYPSVERYASQRKMNSVARFVCIFAFVLVVSSQKEKEELKVETVSKPEVCEAKTKNGDLLTMHYIGTLADGTKFDSR